MIKEYPFEIVPNVYRRRVSTKKRVKNHKKIDNEIVNLLLAGKTLLVDAQIPIQTRNGFPKEFRTLYNTFASRGYNLRCYIYDDIDRDKYRALLMWAEPMKKLWTCSRCANFMVTEPDMKPSTKHCNSSLGYHFWKAHNLEIEEEEVAA